MALWVWDSLVFVFTGPSPTVHHSILHHQTPPSGNQAYDTLSLESSDSMETSVSTGNSACSPERWETGKWATGSVSMGTVKSASSPKKKGHCALFPWQHILLYSLFPWLLVQGLLPCQPFEVFSVPWCGIVKSSKDQHTNIHKDAFVLLSISHGFQRVASRHVCVYVSSRALSHSCHQKLLPSVFCSASGLEAQRIEEMEKMLKEAQQEKARLIENRVSPSNCSICRNRVLKSVLSLNVLSISLHLSNFLLLLSFKLNLH